MNVADAVTIDYNDLSHIDKEIWFDNPQFFLLV